MLTHEENETMSRHADGRVGAALLNAARPIGRHTQRSTNNE